MSADESAAYDAVVARLTPAIERALGSNVLANRAAGRGVWATTRLEPWVPARRAWHGTVRTALSLSPSPLVLMADVRDCYASIHPAALSAALLALGGDARSVARLRELLERLGDSGIRGLPVGPAPSAILANAVLCTLDEGLYRSGIPHIRWVDDIVAFPGERRAALRGLDAVRRALDEVGLEPNPSKTAVLSDPDGVRERLLTHRPSTGGGPRVR